MRIWLKNAQIVTMNASHAVLQCGLLLEEGVIRAFVDAREEEPANVDRTLDLRGHTLTPGFVQTHVHCCQTLFRGLGDDLDLMEWLKTRIWPLEAAHDPDTLAASADLTTLELLSGGTTTILSMETVHHTAAVFDALSDLPLRAIVGKCMMDQGDDIPAGLRETRSQSLDESLQLAAAHPWLEGARLRACFAPRFALSCSEELLREVATASRLHNLPVHTHGAEQTAEVELVKKATGRRNLAYLEHVGLANERLRLAHVIHLDAAEEECLRRSGIHVLHCPSSNLKLGSGIAPVTRYLEAGVCVSIGADGAPCNNNLDALREARLAALLQKPLFGSSALPARTALELITCRGAHALGMEREIGSIEVGKRADLVEFDLHKPHIVPNGDVYSRIIYAADRGDVVRVFFDGEVVMEQGKALFRDGEEILARAVAAADTLARRAGLRA